MDQYLIDDYGGIEEDIKYLNDPDQIEEYFKDCGRDYFDCGQGYFQTEAILLVKIKDKFYEVCIDAEVYGDKQDHGDRLYYVDNITKVSYVEIPKPLPKDQITLSFEVTMSAEKVRFLTHFMEEHNLPYKIL
jgi:hypothetical protein